mgnify:CR=1 FL=1
MLDELRELYQEVILDHGKNPRNFRRPEKPRREAAGKNPLCVVSYKAPLGLNVFSQTESLIILRGIDSSSLLISVRENVSNLKPGICFNNGLP